MYLNDKGVVTGASLSAIVRMLTSKEGVTDYEFTETFFVCFRLFSSPQEVFQRLVARYNEQPSGPLTEAQTRVWKNEAETIQFRVARMLLTWLDLHWRQEKDGEVFMPLINFAFSTLARDLPADLFMKISEALSRCATSKDCYRGSRIRKRMEMLQKIMKLEDEPPTGFSHPRLADPGESSDVDVMDFNNRAGREELARQLTLKASELYRLIDPEDAVVFWRDRKNREVGKKVTRVISFEKSVFYWVIHTILLRETPTARAAVIVFWLDVANVSGLCVKSLTTT